MSLITQAIIVERYGLRLNTKQLAEALGITAGAVHNKISAGTLGVKTYIDGGKRWCDYRDLAEHLDSLKETAE